MKRAVVAVFMSLFFLVAVTDICRAASADEAKAMVDKAVAYWKANGKDKTVAEINNPEGQFVKGDVYVFANSIDGMILANGGNTKLVGQNHIALKDPNGKLFNKECAEVASTKGSGWVDYSWINPTTKKVQPKTVWVQKIEGVDVYIGSGIWK
jgi:signal transduction histidine kinase